MLIFDHAVIYNGKFYPANTQIEEKETISEKETVKTAEEKAVTSNDNKRTGRKPKVGDSSD